MYRYRLDACGSFSTEKPYVCYNNLMCLAFMYYLGRLKVTSNNGQLLVLDESLSVLLTVS